MALVAVGLPVGVLVASQRTARAATPYELLSADASGAAEPGATATVSASSDGRVVAFSQAGADCASSTVFVRDRQAKATTPVGAGQLGAITADGAKVAYVSCTGPEISVFAGTTSTPVTNGQWRAQGATQVAALAVSAGGRYVAFTTDNAQVWVVDTQAKTVVAVPGVSGPVTSPSLSDDTHHVLALVENGTAVVTSAAQPATPTPVPQSPAGGVTGVSISADATTTAIANGSGVSTATGAGSPFVLVTGGARTPVVAGDGGHVAVQLSNGSVASYTTGATPAQAAAATPSGGGFSAPKVSDGGRQLVFIATPGTAAGGSGTGAQAFALGPGLTAAAVDFGPVGINTTATKPVTFTNSGTVPITPTTISSNNSAEFAVQSGGAGACTTSAAIPVGASCMVQVAFTPSGGGARAADISVAQAGGTWDSVQAAAHVTGTGANGTLTADPSTVDFGTVGVGQTSSPRSFTVTNSGTVPTTIGTILVSGGEASEFPLAGGTCAAATLAPAATCTVSVEFRPGGVGLRTASMNVAGSGGATVGVSLQGSGQSVSPPTTVAVPHLAASPTTVSFGTVLVGAPGTPATITVRNTGTGSTFVVAQLSGTDATDFAITSNGCNSSSLAAGSSCSISVSFTPKGAGARHATLALSGSGGISASSSLSGTGKLNPVLAMTPGVVTPGQVVTVVGTDFPANAAVTLVWEVGAVTVTATARADGSFTAAAVTPPSVGNGTRALVVAEPADAAGVLASVLVQTAIYQGPGSPPFMTQNR